MSDTKWTEVYVPRQYDTGQVVFSGASRGTISMVSNGTFSVVWDDGDNYAVVYPREFPNLRAAFPWET